MLFRSAWDLLLTNANEPLWVENESRHIGKNQLPTTFFEQIRTANKLTVQVDIQTRAERIFNEYGSFEKEILIEKTMDVARRMGPQHAKEAVEFLTIGDVRSWINKMLDYYDKTYFHSSSNQENKKVIEVDFSWAEKEVGIRKMINKKKEF